MNLSSFTPIRDACVKTPLGTFLAIWVLYNFKFFILPSNVEVTSISMGSKQGSISIALFLIPSNVNKGAYGTSS